MPPLTIEDALAGKDSKMILEAGRLKTFPASWPLTTGQCIKENLAKAGFYFCSLTDDNDCVRCFCCFKELEGWDEEDDPWKEHRRNSSCMFAMLGKEESELTVEEFLNIGRERELNRIGKQLANYKNIETLKLQTAGLAIE